MIRERQVQSLTYVAGQTQRVDIPRDAVFHWLSLSILAGSWVSTQGAMGTGPTLSDQFPFCLIRDMRLVRNGSDTVWQGSGAQLAKEHYYLNRSAPFARLYTVAANVETLRTATVRGVVVPSNPDGINAGVARFTLPDAPASTSTLYFDMQIDLWLQIGVEDGYVSTLVDARDLATFQLEVTWETTANMVYTAGTANTSDAVTATMNVLSIDQDNVEDGRSFGTFKRSSYQQSNIPYGTQNFQILLPRGNYFHGIILQTLAYKAGSTVFPQQENAVLGQINNRINNNFYLRQATFQQLQGKNVSDYGGRAQPYAQAGGMPQGWAYLYYPVAGQSMSELVPSYVMDQFDLQLSTNAIGASQNGVTTAATNPVVNLLIQEVIPGVSVSESAPRGASAGSVRRTTAKPFGR